MNGSLDFTSDSILIAIECRSENIEHMLNFLYQYIFSLYAYSSVSPDSTKEQK